ncbi:MAG: nucleotidyltransferase family protein [Bacteroidales bacterium]
MKAFVMAAGIGTRLRPLTYHIPKPLVPIVNIPVIGHLMRNLSEHGINKIMANLHYYPNLITSYLNEGKRWDLEIKYSYEKNLLGTAGGVKLQEKFFDDTFIVTSADGLSDINFTKLIKYHKAKRAIATIALKSIDVKLEYGVVETDKRFKIRKFIEKPFWGDVYSDYVNTGIYVLEPARDALASARHGSI